MFIYIFKKKIYIFIYVTFYDEIRQEYARQNCNKTYLFVLPSANTSNARARCLRHCQLLLWWECKFIGRQNDRLLINDVHARRPNFSRISNQVFCKRGHAYTTNIGPCCNYALVSVFTLRCAYARIHKHNFNDLEF